MIILFSFHPFERERDQHIEMQMCLSATLKRRRASEHTDENNEAQNERHGMVEEERERARERERKELSQ
jgi:hypothetical protein